LKKDTITPSTCIDSILVLTTSYPRKESDDAGIFVKRLINALSQKNIRGEVAVPYDINEAYREFQGNFYIKRFRYGIFSKGALAFGAGIIPNLRTKSSLIFQAPMLILQYFLIALQTKSSLTHCNWIITAIPAFFVKILTGKKYIVTLRGEDIRLLQKKLFLYLFYLPLKNAAHVVSVNEGFKNFIEQHYKSISVTEISNGVDLPVIDYKKLEAFYSRYRLKKHKRYFLFIGTIIPRKNIKNLIKVIASIEDPLYELILCGRIDDKEYTAELKKAALELKVDHKVHFLGGCPPEDIPYFLTVANYYVSASLFEGKPNAVLEALASGLSVLVSDIPAHNEIVRHMENGILFPSDSTDSEIQTLVDTVYRLEIDQGLRQSITTKAKASVKHLTWEACAENYIELYKKCTRQQHT
jgi:glycosyltransferase involved in cell wall biosynthesis